MVKRGLPLESLLFLGNGFGAEERERQEDGKLKRERDEKNQTRFFAHGTN